MTAGALSCGAVMRAANQVQTYCYGPYPTVVHNAMNTLTAETIDDYQAKITWDFKVVPTGIAWQYTIDAKTLVSGTLTKVYGSP